MMDLYTLDSSFLKKDKIDIDMSLIWTERYYDAGDVTLVVPATSAMISKLALDTKLSIVGSKEVMIIDTQTIKDNLLTITGKSLVKWLDQRVFRFSNALYVTQDPVGPDNPGAIICAIVAISCTSAYGGIESLTGMDGAREPITNLTVTNADTSSTTYTLQIDTGPVFSIIQPIAQAYPTGITLYLDSASSTGYSLVFKAYKGVDRTSDQSTNPVVQFSPQSKTLDQTTELYSNVALKNVCYCYASNMPKTITLSDGTTQADVSTTVHLGKASLSTADNNSTDFSRRVMQVDVSGTFNEANFDNTSASSWSTAVNAWLNQMASQTLLQNTFTKTVDGEIVPQSQFQYGRDYFLGDIIELDGASGITQKAQVTEYIRSQDKTGERAYPTIVGVS